jgi:hypothetical protein
MLPQYLSFSPNFLFFQTTKNKPAKKLTAAEFLDVMRNVKTKTDACKEANPKYYKIGGPYYSWDNASWHQAADLSTIGIKHEHRLPLPPNSPDMHKVIEHVVGNTKRRMKECLCDNAALTSVKDVKKAMEKVFYTKNKVTSIRKDINSLPGTYKIIHDKLCAGGTEGNWAPARCR